MGNNIYAQWSVATAFNKNGRLRYDPNAAEQRELDWNNSPISITHTPAPQPDVESSKLWCLVRVERVADCIRGLGYKVECRLASRASGKYVISSIYKWFDGDSPGAPRKKTCYYGVGIVADTSTALSSRTLSGRRTIYEKANLERHSVFPRFTRQVVENNLHDISGEFTEQEIKTLIEDGAEANIVNDYLNQKSARGEYDPERRPGVSTIGNTLPNDIVQALQDFRSDCPNFVREPDYEFYIPPSMQETPDACPPPEPANNLGGGAQAAAAPAQAAAAPAQAAAALAQAAAVPAPAQAAALAVPAPASKKTPNTSDTSDTSDSDDDG